MRLVDFLLRMLCALALIGSSWSISASEAVCVMPNRVVMPMATCGMPCCAKRDAAKARCSMPKPTAHLSCCRGVSRASLSKPRSERLAQADCRCELRPKATISLAVAPIVDKAPPIVTAPATLTTGAVPETALWTFVAEPGIIGTDSGPPPQPLHSRPPGRAPPVRTFSSEA